MAPFDPTDPDLPQDKPSYPHWPQSIPKERDFNIRVYLPKKFVNDDCRYEMHCVAVSGEYKLPNYSEGEVDEFKDDDPVRNHIAFGSDLKHYDTEDGPRFAHIEDGAIHKNEVYSAKSTAKKVPLHEDGEGGGGWMFEHRDEIFLDIGRLELGRKDTVFYKLKLIFFETDVKTKVKRVSCIHLSPDILVQPEQPSSEDHDRKKREDTPIPM